MIDVIITAWLFGMICFLCGFFIAKRIYHKNGQNHYDAYLKDIEKRGSWNPHKNGANTDPSTSGWI